MGETGYLAILRVDRCQATTYITLRVETKCEVT